MAEWRHAGDFHSRSVERRLTCPVPTPDPASPCGYEENALFGSCGMEAASWQHFRCIVSENDPEGPCPEPCPATAGCHPYQPTRCATCGHAIKKEEP